jgi:beta-galactosidase
MTSHSFGTGWRFGPASAGSDGPEFDDSGFAEVTLPHTVVPLSWRDWDPAAWERVWMYRKRFDAPSGHHGKRVFLDFAAAMTRATVTLNGTEVADHLGGYLPFSVEVGRLLRARGNVLTVRLDSTFNLNVPPDRPAPEPAISVDYWQPGGIYRDVRLRVMPQAFLADVFAKPVSVLDSAARQVVVQATVDAAAGLADPAHVAVRLLGDGGEIAAARVPVAIAGRQPVRLRRRGWRRSRLGALPARGAPSPSGPVTRTWETRSRVSGSAEVLTRREGARHARADDDLDNDG